MTSSQLPFLRAKNPLATLVSVLALLFVGERVWDLVRHRSVPEIQGAEWIWAPEAADTSVPVAFFAVRDFEIPQLGSPSGPAELTSGKRLAISAEDEYQVFVNGRFLGGGSWAPERPLDLYDLGETLHPGVNRIVVELRSFRGSGGLLAGIFDTSTGKPILGTDSSWRIVRHYRNGLHEGFSSLNRSVPAISWGAPPTGRWGRLRLASEVTESFALPEDPREPRDRVAWALGKTETRLCQTAAELQASGGDFANLELPEEGKRRCEPVFVVDFGAKRCGFLEVELLGKGQVPYRVWFTEVGDELPLRPPEEHALLIPGSSRWRSSHAHDVSRVFIAGAGDVVAARLRLRDGASAAEQLPSDGGVWGLEPPVPGAVANETDATRPTS